MAKAAAFSPSKATAKSALGALQLDRDVTLYQPSGCDTFESGAIVRDFILKFVRLLLGNAWNRGALLLIAAGTAALTGMVQYLVQPIGQLFGLTVTIPDTPPWIGFTLIGIGCTFFVLGRFIVDRNAIRETDRNVLGESDRTSVEKLKKLFSTPEIRRALETLPSSYSFPTAAQLQAVNDPSEQAAATLRTFLQQTRDIRLEDAELKELYGQIIQRSLQLLKRLSLEEIASLSDHAGLQVGEREETQAVGFLGHLSEAEPDTSELGNSELVERFFEVARRRTAGD
ncbi:hypothetical protein [Bradyrhizobium algeriense]|uniref:hypothetical protein n=1 Tax=Bradyrhizobium algeriense TaxID=634784 RepID=UPI0011AE30BB|nr:hypothetical protein [Bradyrhizobium algeriense]